MPFSTSRAVRTPGSASPSSTRVMATAGCIPTTTVSAVQDPCHPGNIGDHPADEGVHDLQRGDVNEDPASTRLGDPAGQIVLKSQRQPVVHVHLDGHQEKLAHAKDRDAFHGGFSVTGGEYG